MMSLSYDKKSDIKEYVEIPSYYDITKEYVMSESEKSNNMTGIYSDGLLIDVIPRNNEVTLDEDRQVAYSARYVISDGVKYDLFNIESICNIRIPHFVKGEIYTVRDLSYILQMRAKMDCDKQLSIALIYKTVNLMIASSISYSKKDYIRLINQLRIAGAPEYAADLKTKLEKVLPLMTDDDYFIRKHNLEQINMAKEMDTDYVEIGYLGISCGECAKYQGRVYCLSGKDKRVPQLPDFIRKTGIIHPSCKHMIFLSFLFEEGTIEKTIKKTDGSIETMHLDILENSNRPFIDDRSEQEKIAYQKYKKKLNTCNQGMSEEYIQRKTEYRWICANIPEMAPKTLGVYTRIKNSRNKKYLELKQKAKEFNYELVDD